VIEYRVLACGDGVVHNIRTEASAAAWKRAWDEGFCIRPGCVSDDHRIERRGWVPVSEESSSTRKTD